MSGQSDAYLQKLLSDAAAAWSPGPGISADEAEEVRRLLPLYYRHTDPDDIAGRSPEQLCGTAAQHRAFGSTRRPGRAKVRVYTPTLDEHGWDQQTSVVEVVTDNAPFLVSSATMVLDALNAGVRLVVHPQLTVARGVEGDLLAVDPRIGADGGLLPVDESWMHIEIDRQSDPERIKEITHRLEQALADVRNVDEDSAKMSDRAIRVADELAAYPDRLVAGGVDPRDVGESVDFLRWVAGRHFTFMGYREYSLVTDENGDDVLRPEPGSGLGLLRMDSPASTSFAALPPEIRAKAREPYVLVLTKANSRATVYRPEYLDYIGVKKFDAQGNIVGERRFLGLFTPQATSTTIAQIPILRRKQAEVLALSGFEADSYDGRDLIELLETFPREELLQIPVNELYNIVRGVLRLRDRRGTKLFMRRDPYGGRYMSCFVYMPRDEYSTRVRLDIQRVLTDAFEGAGMDHNVMIGSAPLARLYLVARAGERGTLPDIDQVALEDKVRRAARSWDADLDDALTDAFGPARATDYKERYGSGITEAYKVDNDPVTAARDIGEIERLLARAGTDNHGEFSASLYQPEGSAPGTWRFRLYRIGEPITLTRVLPVLEDLGVQVDDEWPYEVTVEGVGRVWVYDFGLGRIEGSDLPPARLKKLFEEAFDASWRDLGESDRFNALVVRGGLDWRQITVLRAYAKYLRQTGSTFTPDYVADVLAGNVGIAGLLVELFEARFDPDQPGEGRTDRAEAITAKIETELDSVASLDHDRILRSFLSAIAATLRTNHYQGHPYLVLKLDPQAIPDLPQPRPRFEIYVYSPRVEGVHLRFGSVARGGLRWSDRFEDFRTEILGLVKAQMVKNSVIVPSGAKGGFVCKRLPQGGGREEVMAEVVSCYKQFISGLLDVTDNLVDGTTVHPERTVLHDGDDSYLVVAADKGTATFSDIANEISTQRGFWLGDAFASGGSVGYDHKAMGITARGAWESVKFHFREMGVDTQSEPFSVVGVGDMSGDVFGNGMLLSKEIKLVAAFDHRHVFLDPDPDPHTSWSERERMFRLPRSTWEDYDPSLISEGGGVHPRTAKSITLTPQVKAVLDIDEEVEKVTPDELIRYVLTSPVDLLWNGGIGTYVKAAAETHADVGDKANDQVRVNASDLRAKVVGEGGNLGLTQPARIEFARGGGRVNTDFIDNSAGVDTSDHEVNIKIMLDRDVRAGGMDKAERDRLFIDMTDEVAGLALDNNHAQNNLLAAARKQAGSMLHVHGRYMRHLERTKVLKRKLEDLPSDKAIAERRAAGKGLTSPEFSTLVSYTKIDLKEQIGLSDLADDPYLARALTDYFPSPLRTERFAEGVATHPLRKEIIVNQVVNQMVNRSGITFAFRLKEELGSSAADIARAYLVVQDVLGLRAFWDEVEALDHDISVDAQLTLLLETRKLAERAARWLLRHRSFPFDIRSETAYFSESIGELLPHVVGLLRGRDREGYEERRDRYTSMGVPTGLAERVAAMVPAYSSLDLVEIAHRTGRSLRQVAELYFELADRLNISWWRERIIDLPRDDRWVTTARAALRDDLYAVHADLTARVLESGGPDDSTADLIDQWSEQNAGEIGRAGITLSEIQENERFDLATLSVALRSIRGLVG